MHVNTIHRRRATAAVAAAVSASLMLGATAQAAEQGGTTPSAPSEQGGTNSPSAPSEQGGTTPAPPPEPAPAPAPEPEPEPVEPIYDPGPGVVPSPPPPPQNQWEEPPADPGYNNDYTPVPQGPIHAPNPRAPKVKRIKPVDNTLRVGNFVTKVKDIPDFPNKKRVVTSTNEWAAFAEQDIANRLISIGVPKDEASRKAAATVMGAAAGGAAGGAVAFTGTTIFVGAFSVPIGAGIGAGAGAVVGGGNPLSIAGGAGLGALAGGGVALGAGTAAGTGGAILGALAGGGMGYLLGAGDPGTSEKRPDHMPWESDNREGGKHRKPDPVPSPGANQYQVHVPADQASKAGLPSADYIVNQRGDVNVRVGSATVGWSAEQAQQPIEAVKAVAPQAEKVINETTRAVGQQVQKVVPGVKIQWPQETKSAGKSKHRARHARR